MAVETFVLRFQQLGAEHVSRSVDAMGASAKKTANIMAFFRQALVALSAVRVAQTFVGIADTATRIDNRLRVATKSAEEFARAQKFIFDISNQTRTAVEANAVTYSRLLRSTEGLGFKTEELETAMKGLAYSIRVGGATSQEARNSLIQFSQSLASGALRGDELRSVSEQLPALANAIGKEFGMSGGKLIAFAKANPGILETERVLRGVINAAESLEREAASMVPTIAEGFIIVHNAIIRMLGDFNEATGVFGKITFALVAMAQNMELVALALTTWGVAKLSTMLAPVITSMIIANNLLLVHAVNLRLVTVAQTLWNAAMIANPIGTIVFAIGALIAALVLAYKWIPGVATVMNQMWVVAGQLAQTVGTLLVQAWQALAVVLTPVWQLVQALWPSFVQLAQVLWELYATFNPIMVGVRLLIDLFGGWDATLRVVTLAVEIFARTLAALAGGVLVTFALAIAGVSDALHALGIISEESAARIEKSTNEVLKLAVGMIKGKTSTEQTTEATAKLAGTVTEANAVFIKLKNGGLKGTEDGLKKVETKMEAVNRKWKELNGNMAQNKSWAEKVRSSNWETSYSIDAVAESSTAASAGVNALTGSMASGASQALSYAAAMQKAAQTMSTVTTQMGAGSSDTNNLGGRTTSGKRSYGVSMKGASFDAIYGSIFGDTAKEAFSKSYTGDIGDGLLKKFEEAVQSVKGEYSLDRKPGGMGEELSVSGLPKELEKIFDKLQNKAHIGGLDDEMAAFINAVQQYNQEQAAQQAAQASATASNTAAINANTMAVTGLGGEYADLINQLYNKLDLARKNLSSYYSGDTSALWNSNTPGMSKIPGYADGIDGVVSGKSGVDNNLAIMRLSKGEGVKITPKSEMRKGGQDQPVSVTMHVHGVTDANSFIANKAQVRSTVARAVKSAQMAGRA